LFFITVIYTIYYLYQKDQKSPIKYELVNVEKNVITKRTVATGSVVPRKEIEIKPKISGIVEVLYVQPGDLVKAGDLIAKVRVIPNMLSLNEAESRLNRAKLSLKEVELEFNRKKLLYDQKVIAKAEFETIELKLDNTKEELSTSESNLQLVKEGVAKSQGAITNTLIRSTITGMVLQVPIEEGNSIIESNNFNDGTTIATVANMSEMIFKGKIDESEVGKLKIGMDLILRIGALEGHDIEAKLEYISPKGVQENGAIQFEIKAAVKLTDAAFIRAGYSANADIVLAKTDSVLVIPERLLIIENGKNYVEIEIKPQVFERKEIQTGLSDGISVEIKSGLQLNDKLKGKSLE